MLNNLRLTGNNSYLIKNTSVKKTDCTFQRYILVTEDEMGGVNGWLKRPIRKK